MTEESPPAVSATSEFQLLFPVIPEEEDTQGPDVQALNLVDDVAEFAEDQVQNETGSAAVTTSALKALAYDWDSNELFLAETGAPLVVEDEDTIIEWALTIMNIPAGQYSIFRPAFGSRLLDLIGSGLPTETVYSEINRLTVEALSQLPYIESVEVLAIRRVQEADPQALLLTVSLSTVYSDNPLQLDIRT